MAKGRILIVEDEMIIAREVEHTLAGLGFEPIGVEACGEQAVETARRDRPDLVLMDIMLAGDMDGTEAAAIIHELDIPVIFLTAYTDDETLARVKRTEPYAYLVKPFNRTELRIAIETALYKVGMERRLRESERRLSHARKMEAVGTLAGGIAHDFNNILSAIIGYSEMALKKADPADPMYKRLDRIHKAGMRGRNLVRLLLSFSRPGGLERRPVSLGPLVEEAVAMLSASMPDNVSVHTSLDPEVGPVRGDPNQIHQLVMNLLTNAADAMTDRGGDLFVTLDRGGAADTGQEAGPRPGPCARLVVRDTGHGIAADDLERIFEPFYTTKVAGRGTGMGLAVVHGIVDSYGGRVEVDTAPGQGSEFRVCLPEDQGDARSRAAGNRDEALSGPDTGQGESLLVVDDEPFLMEMVRDMLSDMGYVVTGMTGPEEALAAFGRDPKAFDLVLTDQRMPRLSGEDLARELRVVRPDVPIILCTGFGGLISVRQARELGFADVVRKPLDTDALLRAVRRALDGPPGVVGEARHG